MKNYIIILLSFLYSCTPQKLNDVDNKINNLLSQMTLQEKVGQMTQINLTVIAKGPNKWTSSFPLIIDNKKIGCKELKQDKELVTFLKIRNLA